MSASSLYKGRFIGLNIREGWEFATRGHMVAVAIIATYQDKLVLVEQYRHPIEKNSIELPAGLCGDHGEEELIKVARRELLEETGFQCEEIVEFGLPMPSSPGLSDETTQFFVASGLVKVHSGGGLAEEGENITVHLVSLEDFWGWFEEKQKNCSVFHPQVLAAIGILNSK